MGKQKCWFCERKVEEDSVFLTKEKINHIFGKEGVFSEMVVRDKDVKDWIVCNICSGLIKYLASETTQVKAIVKSMSQSSQDSIKSGIGAVVSGLSGLRKDNTD